MPIQIQTTNNTERIRSFFVYKQEKAQIPNQNKNQMDFPFVGNPWNSASYRPRYEQTMKPGIPIHLHPEITTPPQPVKPKVVSIPVHFVVSERRRPDSDSAVVIQKLFRGFLVRKNMKKIKAIKEEVNCIELTVSNQETVDSIRNDSKERLKVNEMLMSLLIKLDSIRGVDSGVRDVRKSVIKKVIALQEQVDAIVAGKVAVAEAETVDQNPELENHDEASNDDPNLIEQNEETMDQQSNEIAANQEEEESETDSSANPENNIVEEEEISKEEKKESGVNENRRGKEMLERMMEDNEKMMGLMAELFARNEMQTRLLSALSQRVEQLEKAFLFEKLRRKKKRSAGSVDSVEKCGKR